MGSLFEGPQIQTPKINKSLENLSSSTSDLRPLSLNAGGIRGNVSGGSVGIRSSRKRRRLVNNLSRQSSLQARAIRGLQRQVRPGFSDLRKSRLAEIENARRRSVGNLRENLARRRVLGSSFAQDAVTRANLEFAQAADKVQAESFLQELDLTNQLINQQFDARRNAFSTKLNELNLQADLGAKLSAQASSVLQASAQLKAQLAAQDASLRSQIGISQAQLDAQAQAGAGDLFGLAGSYFLDPILSGAGETATAGLGLA